MDERLDQANALFLRAIFGIGDGSAEDCLVRADQALDGVEADLALARGKAMHGRVLEDRLENPGELPYFQRALELFESLGDERGQGEALFWIGCFHHVVRSDSETAVLFFVRARDLAAKTGDDLTRSYALRHLGIADHQAGRLAAAEEQLAESTKLRESLGFRAGTAANLVGLIYVAKAQGRDEEARRLLDEATELAAAAGATKIEADLEEVRGIL
jgi:tetratricopeptide (TPR) repeat protein